MDDESGFIETTGKKLTERAEHEILFLQRVIQDPEEVEKMARIQLVLKGPGGKYRHIEADVKTLVEERIKALQRGQKELEPHLDQTFLIEKGKDIHTDLTGKTVRKRLSNLSQTQELTGQQIFAKAENELSFYRGLNAETEQFADPEVNRKRHLLHETKSPMECAVENYRHFQEVQDEVALHEKVKFIVPKGDIYEITRSQQFQQQAQKLNKEIVNIVTLKKARQLGESVY